MRPVWAELAPLGETAIKVCVHTDEGAFIALGSEADYLLGEVYSGLLKTAGGKIS